MDRQPETAYRQMDRWMDGRVGLCWSVFNEYNIGGNLVSLLSLAEGMKDDPTLRHFRGRGGLSVTLSASLTPHTPHTSHSDYVWSME